MVSLVLLADFLDLPSRFAHFMLERPMWLKTTTTTTTYGPLTNTSEEGTLSVNSPGK